MFAAAAGCSLAFDAGRVQCSSNADCTARGESFAGSVCVDHVCEADPKWACLSTAAAPSMEQPPYRVSIGAADVITQQPVVGATVRLCRKIDLDCATPVSTQTTDATGRVTFSIDASLAGSGSGLASYVELSASGYLPSLYFFNPPIDRNQDLPPVSLVTPLANAGLVAQIGAGAMMSGRGNVVMLSQDCVGAAAAGISISTPAADASTTTFYLVDGLPTTLATVTTGLGYAGMVNVPAGSVTVESRLANPSADLGTISILVRAGATSYSRIVPLGN